MTAKKQSETQAELQALFQKMLEELQAWREAHPQATLDEMAHEVTPRRRALMGVLLEHLALQHGDGTAAEGVECPECRALMRYKGAGEKGVLHLEGDLRLSRAYYHCPRCQRGIFPPGSAVGDGASRLDGRDDPPRGTLRDGDRLGAAGGGELSGSDPDSTVEE